MNSAPRVIIPYVLAPILLFAGAMTAASIPAFADRHCSFARQSAFYARELSDEALKLPTDHCPAKANEARERLENTMEELGICSCAPAEGPLKKWLRVNNGKRKTIPTTCTADARSINIIARTLLTQVEKCF